MAASDPKDPVLSVLRTNDPLLKDILFDKWYVAASDEAVENTKKGLEAAGLKASVVHNAKEALELLKTLVKGTDTFAAHSTTLNEIGFTDYAKNQTDFPSHNTKILTETDYSKSADLRRQGMSATNFITSANAVGQDGSITITDASGSRTGGITYAAKNVFVVIGSNKIVKDKAEAQKRTYEFSLPIESARARVAYGTPGSAIKYEVVVHGGSAWRPGGIHVIIIKQVLGF